MLIPDNDHVPAPCFVKEPAPVPIILAILPPTPPPKVKPEPVMVPTLVMFIAPVPPLILLAIPKVSKPA